MYRIILQTSFFTIYSYGLMITAGFGVGIFYFLHQIKKDHISSSLILNLLIGVIIFSLVGARLFYIFAHLRYYIVHSREIIYLWKGGFVFYGGLIFGLAFSIFYIRTHKLPFSRIADCAPPAIAFGFSIGRVGCFLNGCCYGIPFHFGFVFPANSPAGDMFPNQTLFPVQLISSLNLFLIGSILHLLKRRGKTKYKLLPLFLMLYSIQRFFIEFLRGGTDPILANLTLFQIVSIILILFSLIWWKIKTTASLS